MSWVDIPIDTKLFQNVDETVLRRANAAIENAFINEAGGHSRFPGLVDWVALAGEAPTYLHEWQGDLIAVSNSRVYRTDRNGVAEDVTGVPVSGASRVSFARTDNELAMAAGQEIIRFAGAPTEILSPDAPLSTHVDYIDGYLLALEASSGRFQHSEAGLYRTWNPLDTFSADGKPDDLNAMLITPYREVMLTGVDSVEQFERLPSGSVPFFRRWSVGEGVLAPDTLCVADQGTWAVNQFYEFVRFSGQTSSAASDEIQSTFEKVDNWEKAWAAPVNVKGQKLILLQIPLATNSYGTKGITAVYDYRAKRWFNLFAWDAGAKLPSRWPGWSYYEMWGRRFVGGDGKIMELRDDAYGHSGGVQRVLGRTAHIDKWGESIVDNVRMRVKRGVGTNDSENPPLIGVRCIKDGAKPTRFRYKSLGAAGERDFTIEFGSMGTAFTWQFEWVCTDAVALEIVFMQALVTKVGR